jgi:DNA replication and repair protein RecF
MLFSHKENDGALQPWNEQLVHVGAALIKKRIEFLGDFRGLVTRSYQALTGVAEEPGITYVPSFDCTPGEKDTIEASFQLALVDHQQEEYRIGYSLVGPHRDEFVFQINKLDVRNFASQGQHKTFLIALKLAEFFYLKERCNETPLLLLDDVLSEMDGHRSQRLLEATATLGQVFITSTDERAINWTQVISSDPKKFYIRQGNIDRVESGPYIN